MATRYWKRGSTDWSQAGSWQDNVGGASAVPVSTDAVVIAEGSDPIASGLANSAVDLNDVAGPPAIYSMHVTNGAAPQIGGAGNSLVISSTGTVYWEAAGGFMFLTAGSAGIANVIANSNGHLFLTGGVFDTSLRCTHGGLSANDQVGLSAVTVTLDGGEGIFSYKADATDPTFVIKSGNWTIYRPMLALTIDGGNVTVLVDRETLGGATVTMNGGTLNWMRGGITTLNGNAGHFNGGNATAALTIATANVEPSLRVTTSKNIVVTTTVSGGSRQGFTDNAAAN